MSTPHEHFESGMTTAAFAKAAGITADRALKYCTNAIVDGRMYRIGSGQTARFFLKGEGPRMYVALVSTPMTPLSRAFPGPTIIPVRAGGRVAPINLQRDYV